MPRRVRLVGVFAVLTVLGCAAAPSSSGRPSQTPAAGGQTPPAPPPAAKAPASSPSPEIYTNLSDSPFVKAQYGKWGVQKGLIMGMAHFDPDNTGSFQRPDLLDAWLRRNCRDRDYDGVLCLDWEGNAFRVLAKGPTDPKFAVTVREMTKVLAYARNRRPNAKIGYYGLPLREYWNQDDAWRQRALAAAPIFDASTTLFPSVYDFYGEDAGGNEGNNRDLRKFGNIVALALELAKGKPVYLYVHHRYHNSTKQWGCKLIPEREFYQHVGHLLREVEFNGDKADGVVLWGPDDYYYRESNRRLATGEYAKPGEGWDRHRTIYASEIKPGETIDGYLDRLNPRLYELVWMAGRGIPYGQ